MQPLPRGLPPEHSDIPSALPWIIHSYWHMDGGVHLTDQYHFISPDLHLLLHRIAPHFIVDIINFPPIYSRSLVWVIELNEFCPSSVKRMAFVLNNYRSHTTNVMSCSVIGFSPRVQVFVSLIWIRAYWKLHANHQKHNIFMFFIWKFMHCRDSSQCSI